MIIINGLLIFMKTLTSAAQCFAFVEHLPQAVTMPTEISWLTSVCCRVIPPSSCEKE